MTIDSVTAGGVPAAIVVDETVARVDLPRALAPRDSVTLRLRFEVQIPKVFARFGHDGDAYSIAQWYPKVALYDDLGWHPDPYHYLAEFYGDYGTFDVAITLPDRFWVGATGVLKGAGGGDNEIPLADRETARDSVTVHLNVVPADSLRGRWPRTMLAVESDLARSDGGKGGPLEMKRGKGVRLRVPRGAPVHYSYSWVESERETRQEADAAGRPGPLRLIRASRDTTLVDTLRSLAAMSVPEDSVLPSLKTLRFHADRVHDFAWVASPEYVRGDTTWHGIAIRALSYREDQERWRDQKAYAVSAMEFLTREVGPYIWPSFTSAESNSGGGAMEYPMLIMNDPDIPSAWYEWLDMTIVHEVAHNWFYGMLGSDERAHPWLDEGFTQYMENRYADWKYPRGLFKRRKLLPWMSPVRDFLIDENRYLARINARDEQPIATPSEAYHGWVTYGVGAYSKPAMMLCAFRAYLGDSTFSAFLREYYRSNLLRHPRPADVVRAAEKVSRRDLDDWFRSWLEGTGTMGVSIKSVHHERTEGERVTTVTVRREGARVDPVTVEARFADGTHERQLVPEGSGDARVFFGGQSPVKKVILDPDHEVIERNRLDNRSGGPPLRLKPLYDFRSSEAMTFLYGPVIWHGRAEGVRLGLWTAGRYLPSADFPEGVLAAGGNLAVGTRRGDFSWSAWMARRAGALGARGRLALESARDAGLFRAGVGAGNLATAPGRLHPFRAWQLSLDFRDRYDLAPVDPRYWSPGKGLHGQAFLSLDTQGPRRAEHVAIDLRAGSSAFRSSGDPDPEFHYERVSLEARQKLDLLPRGNAHLSWRVFAGTAFDRPPRELNFDAAEGNRVDSLGRFYLNDRGPLLASGYYWIAGGGGLRGYRGRAALGKRVWGLSADLELPVPRVPVSLFGDLGRVEATGLGESGAKSTPRSSPDARDLVGRPLADAGLSSVFGPVRITVPLWVGRPDPGENPWRVRWLLSIESFPISF
ncbi:MAG TPA: M1 family metallopeptidase [Candidatus Eisenbacteria bacterium]|jgi:hypothetical protein